MSTASVSRYYNTRKREVKHEVPKSLKTLPVQSEDVDVKAVSEPVKTKTLSETSNEKDIVNLKKKETSTKPTIAKKKSAPVKKDKKSATAADKKTKGKQPTLTAYFTSESEEVKVTKTKKEPKKKNVKSKGCFSCVVQRDSSEETVIEVAKTVEVESQKLPQVAKTVKVDNQKLPQSPKRTHPSSTDEGTPSKRKHLEDLVVEKEADEKPKETARRKLQLDSLPSKSDSINIKLVIASPKKDLVSASPQKSLGFASPQKNLGFASPKKDLVFSPRKNLVFSSPKKDLVFASPKKDLLRTPEKLNALVDQSRSKLLLSPRLDELKKSLALFSEKTAKFKEFQSNPYRINAVISTSKSPVKSAPRPTVFASDRFAHLRETDGYTLVLPAKYKVLSEMFRSMDDVVGIHNNRKEKITFEKVKEGVQKSMKRNFDEKHLGQIITILPTAYTLSREKCTQVGKYQLVISLNLPTEDNANKRSGFQPINPACKINRMNEFNSNLVELVKQHHEVFLAKINFPNVAKEDITRWHPKFSVDTVPDVPVAPLPESPEAKVYTAKDVLNKLKDGFRNNKVGKALQSVAEESQKTDVTLQLNPVNNSKQDKDLKGVCSDLLAKIRAKESAKLLKTITQSPAESKRQAMEERVPKFVNILWHYFIAERKSAVPIDLAVEKIIHSFNSLTTPDAVKEHLVLIKDKFPRWLSFIEIPKGVYLTIDKKTNINDMLAKAGLH